uniref:UBC core domain-containing protein n=1 Tax=Ascaris lumbricoides TaxID=6252 RepID=A0A0M3HUU3_ASCLU
MPNGAVKLVFTTTAAGDYARGDQFAIRLDVEKCFPFPTITAVLCAIPTLVVNSIGAEPNGARRDTGELKPFIGEAPQFVKSKLEKARRPKRPAGRRAVDEEDRLRRPEARVV